MYQSTSVKNLKTSICIDAGMDIELVQVGVAQVDVEVRDGKIVKVTAPLGIKFARGGMSISMPDHYSITDLCDLKALAATIAAERAERDEMRIHTSGRIGMREFAQAA